MRVNNLSSDVSRASDCDDYNEYGQWAAELEGTCEGGPARINVVNVNTVPSWTFPECEANSGCLDSPVASWCFQPRHLDYLVGVLRHTRYASPPWILEVRDCLDFPAAERPEDCEDLLQFPISGPRRAPYPLLREIPSCVHVP